jgi:hypothetical protein
MTLLICEILNHLLYKLARNLVSFELGEGLYSRFDVTVNHCHGRFQVYICQTRHAFCVVVVVVVVVVIVVIVVDHKGRGNLFKHINAYKHVLFLG